jgi:hypothetical protein
MAKQLSTPPGDTLSNLGYANKELFSWLWAELKSRVPAMGCRRTKRYTGLYTTEWGKTIFAYIDPQQGGLSIGVFKSVVDRLQPLTFRLDDYPDWSNRELTGLFLNERNPEIIEILDAGYKARVNGLASIQSFKPPIDPEIEKQLLTKIKRDIASFENEEARPEVKKGTRYSNYYERDPKLRTMAIVIHGKTCMVSACGFNFAAVYGRRGAEFIEVHHLKPLSWTENGELRKTNPKTDMAVVCSNCHRMIHRYPDRVLSLDEVSSLIEKRCRVLSRKSKWGLPRASMVKWKGSLR